MCMELGHGSWNDHVGAIAAQDADAILVHHVNVPLIAFYDDADGTSTALSSLGDMRICIWECLQFPDYHRNLFL